MNGPVVRPAVAMNRRIIDVLYLILVLLVATRIFAEVAERVALPAIVGELAAGVMLGL